MITSHAVKLNDTFKLSIKHLIFIFSTGSRIVLLLPRVKSWHSFVFSKLLAYFHVERSTLPIAQSHLTVDLHRKYVYMQTAFFQPCIH